MPLGTKNNSDIKEGMEVFQQIMLDILQRRAVEEALEESAISKTIDESTLKIYAADYVGSQFADLRKFFETDKRAYQIKTLIAALPTGNKSDLEHVRLYALWKKDYENLANQYYFHRQKGYNNPGSISKADLDAFVEAINKFLDLLVSELAADGFVVSYLVREIGTGYYADVKGSAKEFFTKIG